MSEFNHFAKELDAAFRTARSEYAAVYDELTKAKERKRGGLRCRKETDCHASAPRGRKENATGNGAHLGGV